MSKQIITLDCKKSSSWTASRFFFGLCILKNFITLSFCYILLYRSGNGYICYFLETKSLSSKDLMKDSEMDTYIKKDILKPGVIDRRGLAAFTYLKEAEEPSDS